MSSDAAGARASFATVPKLSAASLLAYGLLGLPLAFVALPIYVHLPKLYADFGLSLATIGAVLLAARLWDAVIDPLIGCWGDRARDRRLAIFAAVPLLVAGFLGLVQPPVEAGAAWLLGMLLLVYLGYSLASVNHHALGAELSPDPQERTRITATREGLALFGVVLAAVLPGLLGATLAEGLARLAWLFAGVLVLAVLALRRLAPLAARAQAARMSLHAALRSLRFRRLLAVFALSGIAAAIPASLLLFFVADVLQAEAQSGAFLAIYFVAGAAGLPLWVWLARRRGKIFAWGCGMLLAVGVFGWAATLGAGEVLAFGLICALSGIALGADLALPPSILADLITREGGGAGSYFGWWNFVAKLNLALAAGVSLPLLGWLGYVPGGRDETGLLALAWIYAGVPAFLKLMSLLLLIRQRKEIAS
ncbi:MFS transporter [Uliginosibacterium aquaticum]|uniref:MFS transporter n=1 Tax=Uliginosibacterium aquaticum TaxID=2731212 RepID=A0ABX2IR79_9RHOO|nr:MFS transporter [Uliginosibacterium aquaticum]NSL56500.1 MFS transporter [Uliginosibacterium aquaticum]